MKIIFGIFNNEQLVYPIGGVIRLLSLEQAEAVAALLAPAFEGKLPEGDYFAYDFAERHNMA